MRTRLAGHGQLLVRSGQGRLARAAAEDTLAVPGGPPTSMGGLGGRPASSGQRLQGGRAPPWRQMEPVLLLAQPPISFCNLGNNTILRVSVEHGSNDLPQDGRDLPHGADLGEHGWDF